MGFIVTLYTNVFKGLHRATKAKPVEMARFFDYAREEEDARSITAVTSVPSVAGLTVKEL